MTLGKSRTPGATSGPGSPPNPSPLPLSPWNLAPFKGWRLREQKEPGLSAWRSRGSPAGSQATHSTLGQWKWTLGRRAGETVWNLSVMMRARPWSWMLLSPSWGTLENACGICWGWGHSRVDSGFVTGQPEGY